VNILSKKKFGKRRDGRIYPKDEIEVIINNKSGGVNLSEIENDPLAPKKVVCCRYMEGFSFSEKAFKELINMGMT